VFHERTVPEETKHESRDEDHEDEREKFGHGILGLARVHKALNHFIY